MPPFSGFWVRCGLLGLFAVALKAQAWTLGDPLGALNEAPLELRHTLQCLDEPPNRPLNALDIIDFALCHNPATRETWAQARFNAAQLGQQRGLYLPQINGTISTTHTDSESWNNPNDFQITLPDGQELRFNEQGAFASSQRRILTSVAVRYLLFDFGVRKSQVESAWAALESANWTYQFAVQQTMMQALSSYYQFAASEAAIEAAKTALQSAQESYEAAQKRHDLGTASVADVLQAETALAQAKLDLQNAQGQYLSRRGQLAKDMGLSANTDLAVEKPVIPKQDGFLSQTISDLIRTALLDRADLQSAEKNMAQAKANLESARRSALPEFNLNFNESYSDNNRFGRRKDMLIGVTVNIPIFTGFSTLYQIQAARANQDAAQARYDNLRQTISLDVWQTYQALHTAMENLKMTQTLLKSAEKTAEVALGRYRAGVGSMLDVLSAQTSLFNARQQRIAAEQDWLTRRTNLSFALGILSRDIIRESIMP